MELTSGYVEQSFHLKHRWDLMLHRWWQRFELLTFIPRRPARRAGVELSPVCIFPVPVTPELGVVRVDALDSDSERVSLVLVALMDLLVQPGDALDLVVILLPGYNP